MLFKAPWGETTVNKVIITRLFDSFHELERAILTAKATLETKDQPPADLLTRIDSYQQILEKQRTLATTLCGHVSLGNWDEVARHIKLINGLSSMIRDDAREILAAVNNPPASAESRELLLS